MITKKIHELVMQNNGIKCADVAKRLNIKLNTASSILTLLKLRYAIINREGLWYVISDTPIVNTVKIHLLDINSDEVNLTWTEGYLSALADHKIINEHEFDLLLEWIKAI